jgi:hypothetical protein
MNNLYPGSDLDGDAGRARICKLQKGCLNRV